jgi:hypothetical protein
MNSVAFSSSRPEPLLYYNITIIHLIPRIKAVSMLCFSVMIHVITLRRPFPPHISEIDVTGRLIGWLVGI